MLPFPCVIPQAKPLMSQTSNSAREPSTSIYEFTKFMVDDIRTHPLEVFKCLILSILAVCVAWLFFAVIYGLAMYFGVLESPKTADLEVGADEVVEKDWSDFDTKMSQWMQYTREKAESGRSSDRFIPN